MLHMGRLPGSGRAGIGTLGILPMFSFKKSVFASVDWALMARENESRLAKTSAFVMDLARKKRISCSTPLKVFPYVTLQETFRLIQSGKYLDKIALEIQKGDTIIVSRFL